MSTLQFDGKGSILVGIRDITTRKIVQERNVRDELKSRIFKSFTHEFFSPINMIKCAFSNLNEQIKRLEKHPE